MAVDIKQLRIGSHVEMNGVRRAVFGLGCGRVSFLSHPTSSVALSVLATEVNPIPITPELLVELGCERTNQVNIWRKDCEKSIIMFRRLSDITRYTCEIWQEGCRAVANFRYLHELENFIYLTLGKELIEE